MRTTPPDSVAMLGAFLHASSMQLGIQHTPPYSSVPSNFCFTLNFILQNIKRAKRAWGFGGNPQKNAFMSEESENKMQAVSVFTYRIVSTIAVLVLYTLIMRVFSRSQGGSDRNPVITTHQATPTAKSRRVLPLCARSRISGASSKSIQWN